MPNALDLAELICKQGRGCYLYKLDLARAYRQLPSDPLDWPLLGLWWNNKYYVDKRVPFGLRHGALCCERVTCAIGYAVKRRCNARLVAYIDHMGAATGKILVKAEIEFKQVCNTVTDLGLDLAVDKYVRALGNRCPGQVPITIRLL